MSLRRLGLERIDLFQLHRIDPAYPVADQVGELKQLQDEGKIRHIGLSEVGVEELQEAQKTAEIVSVQNLYNLANRDAEELLDHCTRENIGFIPWFPLATGELSARTVRWARREGARRHPVAARSRVAAEALARRYCRSRAPRASTTSTPTPPPRRSS